jgi:hypothetical protein
MNERSRPSWPGYRRRPPERGGKGGTVGERGIPLFDGTLSGWQMAGAGRFNLIGGGVLESEGGPGVLWYARSAFADFVLYVDWRLSSPEDNSGVYLRFPPLGGGDPEHDRQLADRQGYEVQIDERGHDPQTQSYDSPLHLTGAIYRLAPALKRASRPIGDWNTFVIEAQGRHLSVALNGEPVSRLTADDSRPLRGHIGLQAHHPGARVQFRGIRIGER